MASSRLSFAAICNRVILQVQTTGFGISKETFDGPSAPVCIEDIAVFHIACNDQQLAALDTFGGEAERQGSRIPLGWKSGTELARTATFPEQTSEAQIAAIYGVHAHASLHADRERNALSVEKISHFNPLSGMRACPAGQ